MRYDTIIVGAGPAGLSAAITLKIRNKNVLVISNNSVSEKVSKAHEIQNYLGLPFVKGEDLAERFAEHAKAMGVEILEASIFMIYNMGDFYSLATKNAEYYEANTVILATGVYFGKPYVGEDEFLGRGVSYCATCDAPLYRGKHIVMISTSEKEESEVRFMSEIASKVIYIPLYDGEMDFPDNVEVRKIQPVEIRGGLKADTLIYKNGKVEDAIHTDGIFILRENVSPETLVPGLKLDGRHVQVNRAMETNLPGCFACGDITGTPYQYIKAAGEGNIAALSAVAYMASVASDCC